jgi:hypothetical protein
LGGAAFPAPCLVSSYCSCGCSRCRDRLTVWASFDAAAATIPPGATVVTVTPVFGSDPNISRHHLDHAFTITDPAQVARMAGIINGLTRGRACEFSRREVRTTGAAG